jgi:hypothetical protein
VGYLGERRCPECNLFNRNLGLGGLCAGCDQPVVLAELLDRRLRDIAADTREALVQARDLQNQLYNLAQSVLVAASTLDRIAK